jgi:TonB-dependent receptor
MMSSSTIRAFAPRLACILPALILLFSSLSSPALAQGAGAIAGRVYNPATGQYVRNAEIRIVESGQSTVTGDGGAYRLSPVSPGTVTVEVTYTGYRTERSTMTVIAGQTAQLSFELRSTLASGATEGDAIKLDQFVVSGEREGNAKAIMEQRNSMNITNSVASDVFGDVAEGNVGEFLKHMPGVSLNLVEGEVRTVSLRGLGPEYTAVTLDGVSMASADANTGAAGDARAFSFEQVSLNSMESIEVSKTISADVDANAPAGTINLKTKRAFDRQGRRISWQANATAFGRELTFSRTPGPDDNPSRKIRGGGVLEYSDIFLDGRLGVVLNVSESNVYSEIATHTMTYNTTGATATDTRPVVLTGMSIFHGPRTNRRSTVTLSSDFKATENLILSLGYIHNNSDLWFFFRNLSLNAGTRTAVIGTDPLTSFTSAPNGSVSVNPIGVSKLGRANTLLPKFEYTRGDLKIEGRFSASESTSKYLPQAHRNSFRTLGNPTANGVIFNASRPSSDSPYWTITQVGGPDIANGANFTSPTIQTQDGRFNRVRLFSADVSATLNSFLAGIPVVWKAGVKRAIDERSFELTTDLFNYNYTGPGAGLGAWADYRSPFEYDLGAVDSSLTSISGGRVFYPNLLKITELYFTNPQYFTQSLTAANYYNGNIANKKEYEEEIDAAFLMGTATMGKWIVRAGLRYENTSGDSLEFDPLRSSEVAAAGFPVAGGRATTIPGLEYQYFTNPRVNRTGSYDNFFPSGSIKYRLNQNLDFHFGYSTTIRRPTFRDVAGVWTINDEALRVDAPNPNILPEESDNFSLRAAYYFEPVGIFAVNFFQNNVTGLHRTSQLTAEEYGYDGDLDLSAYTFFSTTSSAQDVRVRGMEIEYSQSLSFLPDLFKGLNVRASYTRNYAEVIIPGMAAHAITGGLGYAWGPVNVYTNLNWHDHRPTNVAGTEYTRKRVNMDAGGSYRFSNRLSLFVNVRNVLNDPYERFQNFPSGSSALRQYQLSGTNYTFGIKGAF